MPTVRLTAFFRDDDAHGWSEQHDIDGGVSVTSLTAFTANFDALMMSARRPLLAGDAYYIGCRASYRTPDGRIAASPILRDPPVVGTKTYSGSDVWVNDAALAVKTRMQNAASTANSDIYLRGVWDEVAVAGVLQFGSGAGAKWKQLLDVYVAALISGAYGWTGINPAATPRGVVTNYVTNGNGTITFTVASTNGVAMPAPGTRIQANFANLNHSNSVLNRSLVVTVVDAVTLTTVQQVAASAFASAGTFVIPVKGFIPYALAGYNKLSRRKTGRPFGAGRGRLSARALR